MGEPRFFLATDNDGHWYIVPDERRSEWSAWRDLDPENEDSWDAPEWARRLGGSPELVTFKDPIEDSRFEEAAAS